MKKELLKKANEINSEIEKEYENITLFESIISNIKNIASNVNGDEFVKLLIPHNLNEKTAIKISKKYYIQFIEQQLNLSRANVLQLEKEFENLEYNFGS